VICCTQQYVTGACRCNGMPLPLIGGSQLLDVGPTRALQLSDRMDIWCLVSGIDYHWAKQWLWRLCSNHVSEGYAGRDTTNKRRVWLHREVCTRHHGPPPSPDLVADHLDGDQLNNQRSNLRWATLSENNRNRYGSAWMQLRLL
jgi:hypothetical protein